MEAFRMYAPTSGSRTQSTSSSKPQRVRLSDPTVRRASLRTRSSKIKSGDGVHTTTVSEEGVTENMTSTSPTVQVSAPCPAVPRQEEDTVAVTETVPATRRVKAIAPRRPSTSLPLTNAARTRSPGLAGRQSSPLTTTTRRGSSRARSSSASKPLFASTVPCEGTPEDLTTPPRHAAARLRPHAKSRLVYLPRRAASPSASPPSCAATGAATARVPSAVVPGVDEGRGASAKNTATARMPQSHGARAFADILSPYAKQEASPGLSSTGRSVSPRWRRQATPVTQPRRGSLEHDGHDEAAVSSRAERSPTVRRTSTSVTAEDERHPCLADVSTGKRESAKSKKRALRRASAQPSQEGASLAGTSGTCTLPSVSGLNGSTTAPMSHLKDRHAWQRDKAHASTTLTGASPSPSSSPQRPNLVEVIDDKASLTSLPALAGCGGRNGSPQSSTASLPQSRASSERGRPQEPLVAISRRGGASASDAPNTDDPVVAVASSSSLVPPGAPSNVLRAGPPRAYQNTHSMGGSEATDRGLFNNSGDAPNGHMVDAPPLFARSHPQQQPQSRRLPSSLPQNDNATGATDAEKQTQNEIDVDVKGQSVKHATADITQKETGLSAGVPATASATANSGRGGSSGGAGPRPPIAPPSTSTSSSRAPVALAESQHSETIQTLSSSSGRSAHSASALRMMGAVGSEVARLSSSQSVSSAMTAAGEPPPLPQASTSPKVGQQERKGEAPRAGTSGAATQIASVTATSGCGSVLSASSDDFGEARHVLAPSLAGPAYAMIPVPHVMLANTPALVPWEKRSTEDTPFVDNKRAKTTTTANTATAHTHTPTPLVVIGGDAEGSHSDRDSSDDMVATTTTTSTSAWVSPVTPMHVLTGGAQPPQQAAARGSSSLTSHLSHDSVPSHFLQMRLLSATALYQSRLSTQPTPLAASYSTGTVTYPNTSASSGSGAGLPLSTLVSPSTDIDPSAAIDEPFFSEMPEETLPTLLTVVGGSPVVRVPAADRSRSGFASSVPVVNGRTGRADAGLKSPLRTRPAAFQRPPVARRNSNAGRAGLPMGPSMSSSSTMPAHAAMSLTSATAGSTTAVFAESLQSARMSLDDLMRNDDAPRRFMTPSDAPHQHDESTRVDDDDDVGTSTPGLFTDGTLTKLPGPSSYTLASSVCSAATLPPGKTDSSNSLIRLTQIPSARPMVRGSRPGSFTGRQSSFHLQSSLYEDESEDRVSTLGSRSRRASFSNTAMLTSPPEAAREGRSGRHGSLSAASSTNPPLSSRNSNTTTESSMNLVTSPDGSSHRGSQSNHNATAAPPAQRSSGVVLGVEALSAALAASRASRQSRTPASVADLLSENDLKRAGERAAETDIPTPTTTPTTASTPRQRYASMVLGGSESTFDTDTDGEWARLPLNTEDTEAIWVAHSQAEPRAAQGVFAKLGLETHATASPTIEALQAFAFSTQSTGTSTSSRHLLLSPPQVAPTLLPQQQQQGPLTSILVGSSVLRPAERSGTALSTGSTAATPTRDASHSRQNSTFCRPNSALSDEDPLIHFIDSVEGEIGETCTQRTSVALADGLECGANSTSGVNPAWPYSRSGNRGVAPSFIEDPAVATTGFSAGEGMTVSMLGSGGAGLAHSMSLISRASLYCPPFPDVLFHPATSAASSRTSPSGGPLRPTSHPFSSSGHSDGAGAIAGLRLGHGSYNANTSSSGAGIGAAADTNARACSSPSFLRRDGESVAEVQNSLSLTALGRALLQLSSFSSSQLTNAAAAEMDWPLPGTDDGTPPVSAPLFAGQGQLMLDYMTAWQKKAPHEDKYSAAGGCGGLLHFGGSAKAGLHAARAVPDGDHVMGSGESPSWQPTFALPFSIPTAAQHAQGARAFSLFSNGAAHDRMDEDPWPSSPSSGGVGAGEETGAAGSSVHHRALSPDNDTAQDALKRWTSAKAEKMVMADSPLMAPEAGAEHSVTEAASATIPAAAGILNTPPGHGRKQPSANTAAARPQLRAHGLLGTGSDAGGGTGTGTGFYSILSDMLASYDDVDTSRSFSPVFPPGLAEGGSRGTGFFSLVSHNSNTAGSEGRRNSTSGGGTWYSVVHPNPSNPPRHRQSSSSSSSGSRTNLQLLSRLGASFKSGASGTAGSAAGSQRASQWSTGIASQRSSVHSNAMTPLVSISQPSGSSPATIPHGETLPKDVSSHTGDVRATAKAESGETAAAVVVTPNTANAPTTAPRRRSLRKRPGVPHGEKTLGLAVGPGTATAVNPPSRRSGAVVQLREPSLSLNKPLSIAALQTFSESSVTAGSGVPKTEGVVDMTGTAAGLTTASRATPPAPGSPLMMCGSAYTGKEKRTKSTTSLSEVGTSFTAKARQRLSNASASSHDRAVTPSAEVPSPNYGHGLRRRRVGTGSQSQGMNPPSSSSSGMRTTDSSAAASPISTVSASSPENGVATTTAPEPSELGPNVAMGRRGSPYRISGGLSLLAPPSVMVTAVPDSGASGETDNAAQRIRDEDAISPPLRDVYATMNPNFNSTTNTLMSFMSPDDRTQDFLISASETNSMLLSQVATTTTGKVAENDDDADAEECGDGRGSGVEKEATASKGDALLSPLALSPITTASSPTPPKVTHSTEGLRPNHSAVERGPAESDKGDEDEDEVGFGDNPLRSTDSPDMTSLRVRASGGHHSEASLSNSSRNTFAFKGSFAGHAEGPTDVVAPPAESATEKAAMESVEEAAVDTIKSPSATDAAASRQIVPSTTHASTEEPHRSQPRHTSAAAPEEDHDGNRYRLSVVPSPPLSSAPQRGAGTTVTSSVATTTATSIGTQISTGQSDFTAMLNRFNGPGGVNDSGVFGDMLPSVYLSIGASASSTSLQPATSPFNTELAPLPASSMAVALASTTSSSSSLKLPSSSAHSGHSHLLGAGMTSGGGGGSGAASHGSNPSPNPPFVINFADRTPKWRILDSRMPGSGVTMTSPVLPSGGSSHFPSSSGSPTGFPSPTQMSLAGDAGENGVGAMAEQSLSSVIPSFLYAQRDVQKELRKHGWLSLFRSLAEATNAGDSRRHGNAAAAHHHHHNTPGSTAETPRTSISISSSRRVTSSSDSLSTDLTSLADTRVLAVNTTNLRELLLMEPASAQLPTASDLHFGGAQRTRGFGTSSAGTSRRVASRGYSREQSSQVMLPLVSLPPGESMEGSRRQPSTRTTPPASRGAFHSVSSEEEKQMSTRLQALHRPTFSRGQTAAVAGAAATGAHSGRLGPSAVSASCSMSSVLIQSELTFAVEDRVGGPSTRSGGSGGGGLARGDGESPSGKREGPHGLFFLTPPSSVPRTNYLPSTFRDNAEMSLRSAAITPESSPPLSACLAGGSRCFDQAGSDAAFSLDDALPVGTPTTRNGDPSEVMLGSVALSPVERLRLGARGSDSSSAVSSSLVAGGNGTHTTQESLAPGAPSTPSEERVTRTEASQARSVRRKSSKSATSTGKTSSKTRAAKTYKRSSVSGRGSGVVPRQSSPAAAASSSPAERADQTVLTAGVARPKSPTVLSRGGSAGAARPLTRSPTTQIEPQLFSPPFTPFPDLGSSPVSAVAQKVGNTTLPPTPSHRSSVLVATLPQAKAALNASDSDAQRRRLVPPPAAPSNTLNPRVSLGRDSSAFPTATLHATPSSTPNTTSLVPTSAAEITTGDDGSVE